MYQGKVENGLPEPPEPPKIGGLGGLSIESDPQGLRHPLRATSARYYPLIMGLCVGPIKAVDMLNYSFLEGF